MCYMGSVNVVGVRELRQNLSVYLDRVKEGETLTVTEHGHDVALLTPLPKREMDVLERLVAEGKATPPAISLKGWRLPPPPPAGSPRSEDVIAEMREERL
jgi:prevent-host-death family protein